MCLDHLCNQNNCIVSFGSGCLLIDHETCSVEQKTQLEEAIWAAHKLIATARNFTDSRNKTSIWEAYIGPDFLEYKDAMLSKSRDQVKSQV
jgi:hypothetical protein